MKKKTTGRKIWNQVWRLDFRLMCWITIERIFLLFDIKFINNSTPQNWKKNLCYKCLVEGINGTQHTVRLCSQHMINRVIMKDGDILYKSMFWSGSVVASWRSDVITPDPKEGQWWPNTHWPKAQEEPPISSLGYSKTSCYMTILDLILVTLLAYLVFLK